MVAPSHLKSFQALDAALRHGSLKAAADALSITPAAVGQRIKTLEDFLGVDLLARGRSGLVPTPALLAAEEPLRRAFRDLEAVAERLDMQRSRDLHIAAAPDFADLWLKPRLDAFRAANPNLRLCINGEGEAPLRLGASDCEVSFGAPLAQVDVDILFPDFLVPVSSPENTNRMAATSPRDRIEGFPLLHLDFYRDDPLAPGWADWIAAGDLRRTAPERGIRFRRIAPAIEAVLASAGLAICGLALTSGLVDSGRLTLPFGVGSGIWTGHVFQARYRADGLARPQVRRFRRWLEEEARMTQAWLEGRAAAAPPASR